MPEPGLAAAPGIATAGSDSVATGVCSPDQRHSPLLVVGRIQGPHGVWGWLRVRSYTREAVGILDYPCWYIGVDSDRRPYTLSQGKAHGKGVIARLESVDDRDQAEALRGREIAIDGARLEDAADGGGGYYWRQLQGLTVIDAAGRVLGVVDHLFETGANDVLVVRDEAGRERLIPYLPHVVGGADLAAGTLRVDWDDAYFQDETNEE